MLCLGVLVRDLIAIQRQPLERIDRDEDGAAVRVDSINLVPDLEILQQSCSASRPGNQPA
eukprot:scaffold388_cov380-Prasinococcus_capsulatus_cf.AAC.9